jgi:cysteinyl-tRNA synthetase
MKAVESLKKIRPSENTTVNIIALKEKCYAALDDDLNSPVLLSHLFEGVRIVNSVIDGSEKIDAQNLELLKELFNLFVFSILGLKDENSGIDDDRLTNDLMRIIINLRQTAKENKDWHASDKIRNELKNAGVVLKDLKEGAEWERM